VVSGAVGALSQEAACEIKAVVRKGLLLAAASTQPIDEPVRR